MQELPSAGSVPSGLVRCRARHWWHAPFRGGDDTVATTDAVTPRLVDLHPADAPGSPPLRVLTPPDDLCHAVVAPRVLHRRRWARQLPAPHARAPLDDTPDAAATAHVDPMAYQWVALLALRSGQTRRVLLADGVGMGKTVQAGLVLADVHARMAMARSLVVVPASLVGQWRTELSGRFGLQPAVLDSTSLAMRVALSPAAPVQPGEVCLVSLDTLRLPEVAALLRHCRWQVLVADEAHLLAPGSARRAAVCAMAAQAGRVLLLTATPFTGDEAVDRQLLTVGEHRSRPDRVLVVARRASSPRRPPVRQHIAWLRPSDAEARLHTGLAAYARRAQRVADADAVGPLAALLLRRRACSSITALVTSLDRRLALIGTTPAAAHDQWALPLGDEGDADDAWLRAPAWDDLDAERACLRELLAEARRCADPGVKVRWLMRWLARCREPVLVFTAYADTLRRLRPLTAARRRVTCLYGAQTTDQRAQAIASFCDGEADLLLATDAASEGLNLQRRCRLVVHMDVPWSPRRLAQRNGRLDRIGQLHQVRATVLAARDTLDVEVRERLGARQARIDASTLLPHADVAVAASRRRERTARAALAACSLAHRVGEPTRHRDLRTSVDARRWAHLSHRLALPTGTTALTLAQIEVTGAHPLVHARRWVAWAHEASDTLAPDALLAASRSLARLVQRAAARSARCHALDVVTDLMPPASDTADLFGLDGDAPDGRAPINDADVGAVHAPLGVRVLTRLVLARQRTPDLRLARAGPWRR